MLGHTMMEQRMSRLWLLGAILLGSPVLADTLLVPSQYPTIQAAIDAAWPGDAVEVADGTYTGDGNRDLDTAGKAITVRSASGDPALCIIDCEGSSSEHHRGFHFHSGETAATIVDGITICNGYNHGGGGVCCAEASSPTLINCRITDNTATQAAAGIYCYDDSSPTITDCMIANNTAGHSGGGICCQGASSPTITNCTVRANTTDASGGGIYCSDHCHLTIIDCTISDNSLGTSGGGVHCQLYSSLTMTNCTIAHNAASNAGGISCSVHSEMMLTNCLITENTADQYGGGVFASGDCVLAHCTIARNTAAGGGGVRCGVDGATLLNCVIRDNTVTGNGGGALCIDSDAMFINCAITGNTAEHGGGIFSEDNPSPTFINCTIADNTADDGGLSCSWDSTPILTNCILWGNLPTEVYVWTGAPVLTYCDVQGGWAGEGNTAVDPVFVDPVNGDYRISRESPCIDAANNHALPPDAFDLDDDGDTEEPIPLDLAGHPRLFDDPNTQDSGLGEPPLADRGAYEYQGPLTLNVPEDYDTIQAAIDGAINGDVVTVELGVWSGPGNRDLDCRGKAITVRSIVGSPTLCIINCEGSWNDPHRGFHFHSGETADTVIRGFTIRNGEAEFGSGICCEGSSPTINHCTIKENGSLNYPGGGLYCTASSPALTHCTISSNTAYTGGGIYGSHSSPALHECTIIGNTAYDDGGGICWSNGGPAFTDCSITGNVAGSNGGGLYAYGANLSLTDCTISANEAYAGGGLYCEHAYPTFTRCTVSDNSADSYGGGVYCLLIHPTFTDCTVRSNSAGVMGGGVYCRQNGSPTFTDSEIIENTAGGGIVCEYHSDPIFFNCTIARNVGAVGGGLHCWEGSNPELTDCAIAENTAEYDGGGVFCTTGSNPVLTNCTIAANVASTGAGGALSCVEESSPTFMNCLITENSASSGGALHCWMADPTFTNCTIALNTAGYGGGLLCEEMSSPVLTNCILWADSPHEIFVYSGTPAVTYCDVQGGWPGGGNIDADPLFLAGPVGYFYLSHTAAGQPFDSPCIDGGNDTAEHYGLATSTTRRDEAVDTGIVDVGYHYPVTGQPFVHGDFDYNGNLDMEDFGESVSYATGPAPDPPHWPPMYGNPRGNIVDFDDDGDVDLFDWSCFQSAFAP
ncbi:MAG: right-handed parallel beta-helix repeat-containing protein [Phycisphaerae bacterium]|jgi:parallel beta-helix repeat protein